MKCVRIVPRPVEETNPEYKLYSIDHCSLYRSEENDEDHIKCDTCYTGFLPWIRAPKNDNFVGLADNFCNKMHVEGCHIMYDLEVLPIGCETCKDFHVISEDNLDCFKTEKFPALENCMETDNNSKPEIDDYEHTP